MGQEHRPKPIPIPPEPEPEPDTGQETDNLKGGD